MTMNDAQKSLPRKGIVKKTGSSVSAKRVGKKALRERISRVKAANAVSGMIELFPHGISVTSNVSRPVFILKDRQSVEVLPVWIHPLDAGIALSELSQGAAASPHLVAMRLLELFDLRLESCVFTEIVGHHQFAEITFRNEAMEKRVRVRADEAMSFCLKAQAKFFSTKAFMARCRAIDADISKLEFNIQQGHLPELQEELENSSKKHPYVM